MARRRRSLWGLLALPLLAGALLVMHGLGPPHDAASAPVAAHAVDAPTDHTTCPTCEPHAVVMVCLAVLGGVVSAVIAARRSLGHSIESVIGVTGMTRRIIRPLRPPDPAWLRLSVILR